MKDARQIKTTIENTAARLRRSVSWNMGIVIDDGLNQTRGLGWRATRFGIIDAIVGSLVD